MAAARTLGVVICSFNGAQRIEAPLAALRRQTLDAGRFEVTVVDDGSDDRVAEVAAAAGARAVRLRENAGLAAARNAGWQATQADVIAFTDDDCLPAPDWLESLLGAFDDDAVLGASGRVEAAEQRSFVQRYVTARNPLRPLFAELLSSRSRTYRLWLYLKSQVRVDAPAPESGDLYSVVGANMAFRRSALEAVGGFDGAFRFGGEEEELCLRLRAAVPDGRLVYAPAAVIEHPFEPGLGDTLRRSRAYGRGNARMSAKHSEVSLIVFPFPLLIGMALALAVAKPRALAAAVLAPLALYPGWLLSAVRTRAPERLLYPYVQLLQETATMAGEVEGARAGYTPAGAAPETEEVTARAV